MSQEPLVREAEVAAFRDAVLTKLTYAVGKDPDHAFDHDWFEAIALAARDHMVEHWMDHTRHIYRKGQKRVYYLSLEFLIGRLLYDSLSNLGLRRSFVRRWWNSGWTWSAFASWSPMRPLATVAWGAW